MSRRQRDEFKTRLEYKLYLARETPEPVFDLSDCGLKDVPHGVFSLCKVFLKEILLLNNNRLDSLKSGGEICDLVNLKILNLSVNQFNRISDDFKMLVNLRELYLGNNKLKAVPETVTLLPKLRILDLSCNDLRKLPETLGNLTFLSELVINSNRHLNSLPKSFCGLRNLKVLVLDSAQFEYPPSHVCENGISEIMEFILNDCGIPYENTNVAIKVDGDDLSDSSQINCVGNVSSLVIEEQIRHMERLKAQRFEELQEIERTNQIYQKLEIENQKAISENRAKLMQRLKLENDKLQSKILELQKLKDSDKENLVQQLLEEEKQTTSAVKKLIETNNKFLEKDSNLEQALINISNQQQVNRTTLLASMKERILLEANKFQQIDQSRRQLAQSVLAQDSQTNDTLLQILAQNDENREAFLLKIHNDSELQKAAVASLLETSDLRTWYLTQHVNLISRQLENLTRCEINSKKLKVDRQLEDLALQRYELSVILSDLLNRQKERREHLIATLKEIESQKNESTSENFWLIRYQCLLSSRPEFVDNIHTNLHPDLLQEILLFGAMHVLPLLSPLIGDNLSIVDDSYLVQAGVTQPDDRVKVLKAIANFLDRQSVLERVKPSAPFAEKQESVIVQSECVICMDNDCCVVFLNCGHMCTCLACADTVTECPICRGAIQQKVRVFSNT